MINFKNYLQKLRECTQAYKKKRGAASGKTAFFFNTLNFNTMNNAIKKEIKKQIHKVNGSHIGTVKNAISIQFPSADINSFIDFINSEFQKKYSR